MQRPHGRGPGGSGAEKAGYVKGEAERQVAGIRLEPIMGIQAITLGRWPQGADEVVFNFSIMRLQSSSNNDHIKGIQNNFPSPVILGQSHDVVM